MQCRDAQCPTSTLLYCEKQWTGSRSVGLMTQSLGVKVPDSIYMYVSWTWNILSVFMTTSLSNTAMRSIILFYFSAAANSAAVARHSNWTIAQTVNTDSGSVVGHAAPNATEVSEYLGIPFAQPPVGELRFAAPLRYSGNSEIDASKFVSPNSWPWRDFGTKISIPCRVRHVSLSHRKGVMTV
jgi:hypothetical protein